jgi:hypothetical protein
MRSFCPDKIDSRPIWQMRPRQGSKFDLMSHSTKDISNHLRGIFMVFE